MFSRQKLLLSLINKAGGQIGRLPLVKLVFLFTQDHLANQKDKYYQFVPYKYGPFSFTLYHDLDQLSRLGYINFPDEKNILLSSKFSAQDFALETQLDSALNLLITKYGKLSIPDLMDLVYQAYPWFTLNSEQIRRRKATQPKGQLAVYTAGYAGWHVDGFLNHLLSNGIRRVIDTRNNPISRSYGFHKSTFSKLSRSVGLEYLHIPELGIPPHLRTTLESYADYLLLFDGYDRQLPDSTVQNVTALVKDYPSVLICVESDPAYCHRSRLAVKIQQASNLPIVNL